MDDPRRRVSADGTIGPGLPGPVQPCLPEPHPDAAAPHLPPGRFVPVAGISERKAGSALIIRSLDRRSGVQLDPLDTAIWRLLVERREAAEVVDLLAGAFPEADRARIAKDVVDLVARLIDANLMEPESG